MVITRRRKERQSAEGEMQYRERANVSSISCFHLKGGKMKTGLGDVQACVPLYIHKYVYLWIYMCVCVHICAYIIIHACKHMHIHKHSQTYMCASMRARSLSLTHARDRVRISYSFV